MIRCNWCMTTYTDYDITDCTACKTDVYMMEVK